MSFWVKSEGLKPFSRGKKVGFVLKMGIKKAKEYLLEGLKN
jgi:hypothetical protein